MKAKGEKNKQTKKKTNKQKKDEKKRSEEKKIMSGIKLGTSDTQGQRFTTRPNFIIKTFKTY